MTSTSRVRLKIKSQQNTIERFMGPAVRYYDIMNAFSQMPSILEMHFYEVLYYECSSATSFLMILEGRSPKIMDMT